MNRLYIAALVLASVVELFAMIYLVRQLSEEG